jgi:hypothetical protein
MAHMLYTKYQLNRRLGRPQSWSGCTREYRNLFILTETEPQFLGHPSHSPVSNLTEPSHLPFRCYPIQITAFLQSKQLLSSPEISHFLMNVNFNFMFTKTCNRALTLARIIHPTSNLV